MDAAFSETESKYKALLSAASETWSSVIAQLRPEPVPNSFVFSACEYIAEAHPEWEPKAPFDAGKDAVLLFDYGVDYVRGVKALIGHAPLFPSICPMLRASWENFGTAAWMLDPDRSLTVESRVARFLLNRLYTANRRKWACSFTGDTSGERSARESRNELEQLIKEWFPDADLPRWTEVASPPKWVVNGQEYPSLSGAVNRFGGLMLGTGTERAKGFYDTLSASSHPSLWELVLIRQPTLTDRGYEYAETANPDSMFIWLHGGLVSVLKATNLVAGYFGLERKGVDDLEERIIAFEKTRPVS